MAGNGGNRSSAPGNNSSLILGILIGMVLGLAVAGAVAWHLSKSPAIVASKDQRETPPKEKEAHEAAPAATPASTHKPPAVAATPKPASGAAEGKQRYDFYTILDKDGAAQKTPGHSAPASGPSAPPKPGGGQLMLQVGSFASAAEADRLKARLAFFNMEATVQSADVPGKGTYYRVRLGPYQSTEELQKANSTLKQNGITDAAQIRAQ